MLQGRCNAFQAHVLIAPFDVQFNPWLHLPLLMQNLTMVIGNPSQRCYANAPWRAFTLSCRSAISNLGGAYVMQSKKVWKAWTLWTSR